MLLESKKAGGAANILVISSVSGMNPPPFIGVYGATKAALDNLVKGLAQELMYEGIRVNSLAPGLIRTEFSGPLWKTESKEVPKEAMGEPEHIGSVAACICSPKDGAFMNGEIFYVHGGFGKLWN